VGRLVSLKEANEDSLIYFRELDYYGGQYHFNLKKEYPYPVCLYHEKTHHLVTIRETLERQCAGIAIYHYVEMDYQYPNPTDLSYGNFSIQKHGYYVIRCQLEEDQMILKLKIPNWDTPQLLCPQYQDWHSKLFEAYNLMCEDTGSINHLDHQWDRLGRKLADIL